MASTSWPAGAGTRVTNDPQYERLAAAWAAPGVIGVPTDTAVVYADGTGVRTPKIRANKFAQIRGWGWHSGTTDFSLPSLAANASGSDRFDTVVLRFSRSTYTVVEAVNQGANGGAAGAASLTQSITEPLTSGTFEIPLAVVRVGAGATTIAAGDVTPCAWFSSADAVVTNSTSYYQPAANLGFTRLRHADLGVAYVPYSGAWRRQDWGSPWGILGYGERTSDSGFGAGEIPILATPSFAVSPGRMLQIKLSARISGTSDNDAAQIFGRYTTNGSAPTGGGVLQGSATQASVGAFAPAEGLLQLATFPTGAATQFAVAMIMSKVAGSGNLTIDNNSPAYTTELVVLDMGPATADTGQDQ